MNHNLTQRFCWLFLLLFMSPVCRAQNQYLYTNNQARDDNTVSAFLINPNGALTPVQGSPFSTGGRGLGAGGYALRDILIHGNFLFASNSIGIGVSVFSIDPNTGKLKLVPGSPFLASAGSNQDGVPITITNDGKFLMVSHNHNGGLSVFNVGSNGALSHVPGSPFIVGAPYGMKVTPDNKFLVGSLGTPGLAVFNISPTGAISQVQGSPFFSDSGRLYSGLDISCDGKIFVTEAGSTTTVHVYTISQSGVPTAVVGSPFYASQSLNGNVALLSPNQEFLFTSNQYTNSVTTFRVGVNGGLTSIFDQWHNVRVSTPLNMAINSTGTLLYLTGYPCTIEALSIGPDGRFLPLDGFPICIPDEAFLHSLASYPAASCGPPYDTCIQDESSKDVLKINTSTGTYQLTRCRDGSTLSGQSILSKRGCTISLQDSRADRRITANIDTCSNRASASIQIFAQGSSLTLNDRNTTNNTCNCPNSN